MKTFEPSGEQLSLGWDSSAAASPARTCQPPARVLACKVLAAAFGSSLSGSSASSNLSGSWSRTWRLALRSGWTLSAADWNGSAMRAFRSRLRQLTLGHRTDASVSSLWPALTTARNLLSPAIAKWPAHRALRAVMLPTLLAQDCWRPAERTRQGSPSLRNLLPTLCSRDAKGIGPMHTKGGQDLPRTLGGNLNADWCRWYMGFPPGWLDVLDASKSDCSETASCPSAPKSSVG